MTYGIGMASIALLAVLTMWLKCSLYTVLVVKLSPINRGVARGWTGGRHVHPTFSRGCF